MKGQYHRSRDTGEIVICDECKRDNAIYYKSIEINGKRAEKRLCAVCLKKYGGVQNDFSLLKYSGLFGAMVPDTAAQRKKQIICGLCGTTYNEFLKTGYLGCAQCYEEFKDALAPVILKTQGAAGHIGKRVKMEL